MRIEKIELIWVRLPFKISFKHFLARRNFSDNLIVKTTLGSGITGYGEGIPRKYLTGETIKTTFKNKFLLKKLIKREIDLDGIKNFTLHYSRFKKYNSLLCAAELSILDAYCKSRNIPVSKLIGKIKNKQISYSGIISADNFAKVAAIANEYKKRKVSQIKVKVGTNNDEKRIGLIRKILPDADIRIDANCAWSAKEAVAKINKLLKYDISAVEQPVKVNDFKGLGYIKKNTDVPIIADESLINLQDAEKLLECADIFNIRISKCGGIFNSIKIYNYAKKHKKESVLGCQVGESGILSAAGRALASCLDFKYAEGSYNKYLLKKDITNEDLSVSKNFSAKSIYGSGIGVSINQEILDGFLFRKWM